MLMNRKHTSFDPVFLCSKPPLHSTCSRVDVSLKVCSLPVLGSSRLPKKVEDPDVFPFTSASLLHGCVIPL